MKRIKFEMFKRGISERMIAAKAETDQETVSRIVNGKQKPGFKMPLGIRIADAIGWEGDPRELFDDVSLEEVVA